MANIVLVPIHPPHFHWAKKLLDSAGELENIGLIFSTKEDASNFSHPFPYRSIIVDPIPDDRKFAYIHNKKLNAVKQLQKEYDFISVIDAEAIFIKPTTPYLGDIWNRNCFLGNHSVDGARITSKIAKLCGYNNDDDLYIWFNEIPVYKTSLLSGFFEWLSARENVLKDPEAFDFLLFAIYCKFELGMTWRVLGTHYDKAWHSIKEDPQKDNFTHLINESSWNTYYPGISNNKNIKIIFHLDRYPME